MSVSLASRTLIRQSNRYLLIRRTPLRWASTTEKASETASQAASKTKETATTLQSRASEGFSKVTSSAGPAITGAAKSVSSAVGRIGGPVGRLVQAIESAIPPTIYYSRVALELGKLVFNGRTMHPPTVATFRSYLDPIFHAIRHPSSFLQSVPSGTSPESILSRLRNIDRASLAAGGVVVAELLGFFTVGEMIGRMKLIGYHGEAHHEH